MLPNIVHHVVGDTGCYFPFRCAQVDCYMNTYLYYQRGLEFVKGWGGCLFPQPRVYEFLVQLVWRASLLGGERGKNVENSCIFASTIAESTVHGTRVANGVQRKGRGRNSKTAGQKISVSSSQFPRAAHSGFSLGVLNPRHDCKAPPKPERFEEVRAFSWCFTD